MIVSTVREAVALLRDKHLDWSEDFELIREPLADLLEKILQLPTHQLDDPMGELATRLVNDPHEAVDLDPLEQWIVDAAQHLGLFDTTAKRSASFKSAVRRLFDAL